ncbi:MAG TPA: hypothetical protein VG498_03250 [Terriglobales bacterium]|nr:hypothetical protein [Terriglobales bacterium]
MRTRNGKSISAVAIADKNAVCTAKQARDLLENLRQRYQRLTPGERNQVKLFISDLSESRRIMLDMQALITNAFPVRDHAD